MLKTVSRSDESKSSRRLCVAMVVWNTFENDARVLKEAQTLCAAGHQVTVVALHTPGETLRRETLSGGVRVERVLRSIAMLLRTRKPGKPRKQAGQGAVNNESGLRFTYKMLSRALTQFGLWWRLVRSRPDVIHGHDVNTLLVAWIAARLSRAKLVYDAHEISVSREGYRGVRGLVAGLEKRLVPRTDAMITTTASRAKFFARAYGVRRPLVLQNRPRFMKVPKSDRIREELDIDGRCPIVLYQGGLQAGRGLERLIRSATRVLGARFVLIGGGRLQPALKRLVEELDLAERVHFIPTVPLAELPAYTASADIGIQALENTCFNHFTTDSNKLFEYVMAGLPVVVSAMPEMARIVRYYQVGRLVSPGCDDELVAAISELVEDADERARLSKRARTAARELCWETQERALIDLYCGLS